MATILNLGCGTRTSPRAVNIDFSPALRMKRSAIGRVAARLLVRGYRREAFDRLAGELLVHDLRKGIPYPDGSVDVVYHSHVLEHIDREDAPGFLREILRVLRPGGVQRIVVPDFEAEVRAYVASLERRDPAHDESLVPLLWQSVQREAHGTSLQAPWRRTVENLILGDARRRGQTHQWMYDELNLTQLLTRTGFVECERHEAHTSGIPGWNDTGLDLLDDGTPYKPGSLYLEAKRPTGGRLPGGDGPGLT